MDEVDDFFSSDQEPNDQNEEVVEGNKVKDLVQQLIDKAVADQHSEIEEIRTLSAYLAGKVLFNATKSVYKNFKKSRKNIYKEYVKKLNKNPTESNFDYILLYKCMKQCEKYYKIECKNIDKALDDCLNYAFSGHLLDFLLN